MITPLVRYSIVGKVFHVQAKKLEIAKIYLRKMKKNITFSVQSLA
jgi:hypothetical protein